MIAGGAGLRIELLAEDDLDERAGRLLVPATGTPLDDDEVRALRAEHHPGAVPELKGDLRTSP
jgi:hypothetical protein